MRSLQAAVVSSLWHTLPHAPRRFLHATPARLGIMDTLNSLVDRATSGARTQLAEKTEEQKAAKMEEMWHLQLNFLLASPTYTIADHTKLFTGILDKATAGTTGWRSMLLTEASKANLADAALDVRIGEAFTSEEVAGHAKTKGSLSSPIDASVRARVAAAVGTDTKRVAKFLDSHRQSALMHSWLQGRKAKGEWRLGVAVVMWCSYGCGCFRGFPGFSFNFPLPHSTRPFSLPI